MGAKRGQRGADLWFAAVGKTTEGQRVHMAWARVNRHWSTVLAWDNHMWLVPVLHACVNVQFLRVELRGIVDKGSFAASLWLDRSEIRLTVNARPVAKLQLEHEEVGALFGSPFPPRFRLYSPATRFRSRT